MAPRFHRGNNAYLLDNEARYWKYSLNLFMAASLVIGFIFGSLSWKVISSPAGWLVAAILVGALYLSAREYSKWRSGAEGEKKAKTWLMATLPPSFAVFHDVKLKERGGNIDFVVVGRTGVFALEVKNNDGRVEEKEGELVLAGKKFIGGDPVKQSRGEAASLQEELDPLGVKWVNPVVVLSRQEQERWHWPHPFGNMVTHIVSLPSLLDVILSGNDHLADETVEKIEKHLAGKFCKD